MRSISLLALALLPSPGLAQQPPDPLYTVHGDASGDQFGFAVTGVGDLDGDGHAEFCVGSYAANSSTGYIRVFSGRTGEAIRTIAGTSSGDRFGYAVRNAGDVNKDGFPDIVVGAPALAPRQGYARVISGLWIAAGQNPQVLYTFQGQASHRDYGFSVSDADDVDRDGYDDVLVGAPQLSGGSGYAELRSGRTGNVLFTYPGGSGFSKFGRSVSNAGDTNQDGYPDALIGGVEVWRVMSGKDGSLIRESLDLGGKSVSGADDFNGDGYDDVIVFDGAIGKPRVFSGKDWSILRTLEAGSDGDETTFMSRAGDVDADGYADVIVNGSGARLPAVYSGKDGSKLVRFNFPGVAVSEAGDVNGDGFPDFLVGNPGVAHVFPGPIPAVPVPFGIGCPGSAGIPVLAAAPGSLPRLDQTFTVQMTSLPASAFHFTFGIVGFSKSIWAGNALPLDLGVIGIPGCTQYVSMDASVQLPADTGTATWEIPIPNDPDLNGLGFFLQGVVVDYEPVVNVPGSAAHLSVTNALQAVIGGN